MEIAFPKPKIIASKKIKNNDELIVPYSIGPC